MREHARPRDATLRADPCGRDEHVVGLDRVSGKPQRPVGLDRRRELARRAVEVRPGPVLALL